MPLPTDIASTPGAQDLHDWFGYWPDFHEAEIIHLHLNRSGPSSLMVHTWETSNRVDSNGHNELEKHVLVEFLLDDVTNVALDDFSNQNVISSLAVRRTDSGFRLTMGPCYGLSGSLETQRITIRLTPRLTPGQPPP